MLSYRHAFHAGNHADVLKHLVLSACLHYATRKEAPLLYIDTHAGAGRYSLNSEAAQKTSEARQGVLRLEASSLLSTLTGDSHTLLKHYLARIAPYLAQQHYPGSPLLAADCLRPQDHLQLFEKHPADLERLQRQFRQDRRVQVRAEDGYQSFALLPPVQKRALVLVDPPYEVKEDYRRVSDYLQACYKRMPGATLLLWYPVVERRRCDELLHRVTRACRNLWQAELGVADDSPGHGMTASGMLMINPPWILPDALKCILPPLQKAMAPDTGFTRLTCLRQEKD